MPGGCVSLVVMGEQKESRSHRICGGARHIWQPAAAAAPAAATWACAGCATARRIGSAGARRRRPSRLPTPLSSSGRRPAQERAWREGWDGRGVHACLVVSRPAWSGGPPRSSSHALIARSLTSCPLSPCATPAFRPLGIELRCPSARHTACTPCAPRRCRPRPRAAPAAPPSAAAGRNGAGGVEGRRVLLRHRLGWWCAGETGGHARRAGMQGNAAAARAWPPLV